MRKAMLVVIPLVIVGILTLFYLNRGRSAPKTQVYQELKGLKDFDVASVQGDYFLIHFWAKWCEPCAEEIPHLVNFAKVAQFQKPFKVLAISLDPSLEESKSILPHQGEGLPENFILKSDPEHHIAEHLGSYQYPETYFIGPNGEILDKWIGPQKWDKPEAIEYFKHKVL